MTANVVRVETTPKLGENMRDVRGDSVKRQLKRTMPIDISQVRSIVGYLISSQITSEEISQRADDVLFCRSYYRRKYDRLYAFRKSRYILKGL